MSQRIGFPAICSELSLGALAGCSVQISQEGQGEDDTAGGILVSLGLPKLYVEGRSRYMTPGHVEGIANPQRAPLTAQLQCSQSQAFPDPLSREPPRSPFEGTNGFVNTYSMPGTFPTTSKKLLFSFMSHKSQGSDG